MEIYRAIILGIVQGLTEFLPVSSSGHLILIPFFFGWEKHSLVFDTSLHLGTALAVLLYFWRDWIDMLFHKRNLLLKIILGSFPAAVAGVVLERHIELMFRNPLLVAISLLIVALVIYLATKITATRSNLTYKDTVIIGVSQILALIPGVSRSGITISTALFRKISLRDSVKFSFYLSAPIVIGAGLYNLYEAYTLPFRAYGTSETIQSLQVFDASFVIGVLTSFIVGLLSIKFMLDYVSKKGLNIFIWYRCLLALLVFGVLMFRA